MLQIRSATPADLDFIVFANTALARETESVTLDDATLRAGVLAVLEGRAPCRYWIATRDGETVGQVAITYEWSDWRNRLVWWIQSVYVVSAARKDGVFKALYQHVRAEAIKENAGGIRLYVDTTNMRAQSVYAALGMNGGHYKVFEDMFM